MRSEIRSQRLRIRRFTPADTAGFSRYRNDPDVARYQGWDVPFSLERARELVLSFSQGADDAPGWIQWAVERLDSPGIIGDIGVDRHDEGRQATIGFTLAAEHQGFGYATEAVGQMVNHLFAGSRMHRVSADCDARNLRSVKLLERLAFRREGHLLCATWANGEWTDDYLYAQLRTDWSTHQSALSSA